MMAKNTPARNMTAHVAAVAPARHRAVVERILGVERIFFYSFLFSASSFLNHE